MNTEKCLLLSTGHLTEDDFNFIMSCRNDQLLSWPEKSPHQGYGVWLYVSSEPEYLEDDACGRKSIMDVMLHAYHHGCNYIRLSPDVEVSPELPHYSWQKEI